MNELHLPHKVTYTADNDFFLFTIMWNTICFILNFHKNGL